MDDAVREVQPPLGLAAAVGALGTGLRVGGGSRRNGFTAERGQLTGGSAGRGVSASRARVRAGPEPGAARPPRHRIQGPGGHAECPKHTETGLVRAKYGKSPGCPELSGNLGYMSQPCVEAHRWCAWSAATSSVDAAFGSVVSPCMRPRAPACRAASTAARPPRIHPRWLSVGVHQLYRVIPLGFNHRNSKASAACLL